MQDKVYVVTAGYDSDYHICGIFSSREQAQEHVDLRRRNRNHLSEDEYLNLKITSWELDQTPPPFYMYITYSPASDSIEDWDLVTFARPYHYFPVARYFIFTLPYAPSLEDNEVLLAAAREHYNKYKEEEKRNATEF